MILSEKDLKSELSSFLLLSWDFSCLDRKSSIDFFLSLSSLPFNLDKMSSLSSSNFSFIFFLNSSLISSFEFRVFSRNLDESLSSAYSLSCSVSRSSLSRRVLEMRATSESLSFNFSIKSLLDPIS